jgi:polyisoprenoid-binding protein YceI
MATTKWTIDPTHSEVGFKVKHMMFTNVSGRFGTFNGSAETEGDNFENAKIDFEADVTSIDTNSADRDNHLKSGDFFDAEQFPKLTFQATEMKKDGDDYKLSGDLTIHGVTKPVTLNVEYGGIAKDPWGNEKAGFSINGKLNRKDYGLTWNAALETGGVLVSDEVKLNIELQMVKQG